MATASLSAFRFEAIRVSSSPTPISALLLGIGDGTVSPRYQGMLGNLDKAWRWAKRVAPFLTALDFLPRFAFVAPFALLLLYGFLNMLCGDDEEEDDDDESDDAKKQD